VGNVRLLFDVGYLARRAFHAARCDAAAVPGMVVAEALRLAAEYDTDLLAFAFDAPPSLRKKAYVWYKADRLAIPDRDAEQARRLNQLAVEVDVLRTAYLPGLGYRNVFHEPGYEADDGIAAAVWDLPCDESAVIVSQDSDLYQLLGPGVVVHRPVQGDVVDEARFSAENFGVRPADWPRVTALAGGKNNMPGAKNVGLKTACKYLAGTLPPSHRGTTIAAAEPWMKSHYYQDNLEVCRLPFRGCPTWVMEPDPDPADVPTRAALLDRLVPRQNAKAMREGIDR